MTKGLRSALKGNELRRLYLVEKLSLEDIARLYGVSRVAIWKYCRDVQLTRRNRSEARLEAQKRGKVPQDYFDINENFFSKWSPEMAYVLGLIASDGCISKAGTVSLCINDRELLEKVRLAMGSKHTIKSHKYQRALFGFRFARQKLTTDLRNLGILPKKSLTIGWPNIPDVCMANFIRGVFDGDGSVYFEKRSRNYPVRTSFVSGSQEFIEKLEVALQRLGLPKRVIHKQKTKNGTHYKIRYSHEDSKKVFKVMYYNTQNGLFLERKYKKFLDGFSTKGASV